MFRPRRFILFVTLLCCGLMALSTPVQAANEKRLALEPGSHELVLAGQRLLIETNGGLKLWIKCEGELIEGILEPISGSIRVTVTLEGNPVKVLFEGNVETATPFDSAGDGETGHAEM